MSISTQNPRPRLPPAPAQDIDDEPTASAPPSPPVATDTGTAPPPASTPVFLDPRRTPLAAAFRYIQPSWRNYIMYVDMEARAGNIDARNYLDVWNALPPGERRAVWPEQLCDMAHVSPSDLIAMVSKQAFTEQQAASSMCLSFMKTQVLDKTAEFAMASPDNYRHAELFLKSAGALPVAARGGGLTVPIFNMPTASSGSVALSGSKSESSPVAVSGLRSMDDEIVELSRIMQTGGIAAAAEDLPDEDEDEDDDKPDKDDD